MCVLWNEFIYFERESKKNMINNRLYKARIHKTSIITFILVLLTSTIAGMLVSGLHGVLDYVPFVHYYIKLSIFLLVPFSIGVLNIIIPVAVFYVNNRVLIWINALVSNVIGFFFHWIVYLALISDFEQILLNPILIMQGVQDVGVQKTGSTLILFFWGSGVIAYFLIIFLLTRYLIKDLIKNKSCIVCDRWLEEHRFPIFFRKMMYQDDWVKEIVSGNIDAVFLLQHTSESIMKRAVVVLNSCPKHHSYYLEVKGTSDMGMSYPEDIVNIEISHDDFLKIKTWLMSFE